MVRALLTTLGTIAIVLLCASWLTRIVLAATGYPSATIPVWFLVLAMVVAYTALRFVTRGQVPRI